jgi:hypothetical protein
MTSRREAKGAAPLASFAHGQAASAVDRPRAAAGRAVDFDGRAGRPRQPLLTSFLLRKPGEQILSKI